MNRDHLTPQRRSPRLKAFDYTQAGAYLVTTTTWNRQHLFGHLTEGEMRLSACGRIAQELLAHIPSSFPRAHLDESIVMPDHVHLILFIDTDEQRRASSHQVARRHGPASGSLSAVVGSYKSIVSRKINALRRTPGGRVWARNYHERIIRDERGLFHARRYVQENVLKEFVGRRPLPGPTYR